MKLLIHRWIVSLGLGFADSNLLRRFDLGEVLTTVDKQFYLVNLAILALVVGAAYVLIKQQKDYCQPLIFLLLLLLVGWLPLVFSDIWVGGSKSAIPRYLLPSYLSMHLLVAFLLSEGLFSKSILRWKKHFWQISLVVLIMLGLSSCLSILRSDNWWHRANRLQFARDFAALANTYEAPLVISDDDVGDVLALTYLLNDDTRLQLVKSEAGKTFGISKEASTVFLYKASEALQSSLEMEGAEFEVIQPRTPYWQGSLRVIEPDTLARD